MKITFAPDVQKRLSTLNFDTNVVVGTNRRIAADWRKKANDYAAKGDFGMAAVCRRYAQKSDRSAGDALNFYTDIRQNFSNLDTGFARLDRI